MLANMPHLPRHVEPDIARRCDEAVRVALEHVIRNAGARASDDAILSLAISHKLHGTGEWFVIHHTKCGMEIFTDEVIGASSCHPP
jgi:hypothetical protein